VNIDDCISLASFHTQCASLLALETSNKRLKEYNLWLATGKRDKEVRKMKSVATLPAPSSKKKI
jgi:hypothetical protein